MQEVKVQSPGKLCFLLFFLQQAFQADLALPEEDRKSTRLNSSHLVISYAVFCLKKKKEYDVLDHLHDEGPLQRYQTDCVLRRGASEGLRSHRLVVRLRLGLYSYASRVVTRVITST